MAKRRSRLPQRIEKRRQQGQLPTAIARYVHNTCHTCWSKKFPWTPEELEELQRLDCLAAERKAEKAKKEAEAAARHAEWLASLPPPPPNLGRDGLSPKAVQELLDCKPSELDLWASDGRMPPDGERFYYGVGNGAKKLWGRAWHIGSVVDALPRVHEWRVRDREMGRWRSQVLLFNIVSSRYSDAVFQWSPDWLDRQSVDVYVPSINVAFEFQGEQHYKPIPFFGGEKRFLETQARDARKRRLLASQGVALIEWWFDIPIDDAELNRTLAFVSSRDEK